MYNTKKMTKKIVGTFIPLSALPKNGTIEDGIQFLDWLEKMKQNAWQVLPLHETHLEKGSKTKHVPSPYKSYGIGLDPKYGYKTKSQILEINDEFIHFEKDNAFWLSDYALFCSLRDYFGTDLWTQWDKSAKFREPNALYKWEKKLITQIQSYKVTQWQLHKEFSVLRTQAEKKNIALIGDLPFYLPLQSPLVWANQNLFDINPDGSLSVISGVVRRADSPYGRQIWGHPLYNWQDLIITQAITKLFIKRIKYLAGLFDVIRLDAINYLFRYCRINIANEHKDTVLNGPGETILKIILQTAKESNLSVFAEDAGAELTKLQKALKDTDIPGIKIFRYAYNNVLDAFIDTYTNITEYPENSFAYTTTHDTEPLVVWLATIPHERKVELAKRIGVPYEKEDSRLAKHIRKAIIQSPSKITIIPMQDWLLTKERINIPGTEKEVNDPNWRYKLATPISELPIINVSEE